MLVFAVVAVGVLAGAGVMVWRQMQHGRDVDATVELLAIRSFRNAGSVVVARSSAITAASRNGNDITFRFTATIPVIDTSEGRFSWNVQLETRSPKYRATFLIDVA